MDKIFYFFFFFFSSNNSYWLNSPTCVSGNYKYTGSPEQLAMYNMKWGQVFLKMEKNLGNIRSSTFIFKCCMTDKKLKSIRTVFLSGSNQLPHILLSSISPTHLLPHLRLPSAKCQTQSCFSRHQLIYAIMIIAAVIIWKDLGWLAIPAFFLWRLTLNWSHKRCLLQWASWRETASKPMNKILLSAQSSYLRKQYFLNSSVNSTETHLNLILQGLNIINYLIQHYWHAHCLQIFNEFENINIKIKKKQCKLYKFLEEKLLLYLVASWNNIL